MTETATISKGTLQIPPKMRSALHLDDDTEVNISIVDGKIVIEKSTDPTLAENTQSAPKKTLLDYVGYFKAPHTSLEEEKEMMMEAVAQHVLGEDEED